MKNILDWVLRIVGAASLAALCYGATAVEGLGNSRAAAECSEAA